MEPFIQTHSSIVELKNWHDSNPNLTVGLTTRKGGVSEPPFDSFNLGLHVNDNKVDVLTNRKLLSQLLHYPIENWVMGEQTHGVAIHVVTPDDKGKGAFHDSTALQDTDGLITKERNVLLSAMFADCVPLYFWDTSTNWIGIAHAGWKGTVNQMAGCMVEKLQEQGANLDTLLVAIGPSIAYCNYEIDQYVYDHIPAKWRNLVTNQLDNSNYLFNLSKLNYYILIDQGIQPKNIYQSSLCTYSDSLFFSHRYENGQTGRMLGYIGRR
ncbi:Laccase domain protein [Paraliobacillus sp. PM-2]|uniref:peptidoglycan editing factor PgeF n=1 Tax=Paraliobacillus sp. PM-2 TaxID=1462524 RepID=UPI00061BBEDB|nr:peptidoglycan editing factor PgeF [Paraliobacillus sp. PM-2]CQR47779.1 Laccase domain protein [Paraliobacillus sp. PM-2]